MIVLGYGGRRPLHEQVVEQLQELIFNEVLPQDLQLPSVRSLVMGLSINPNTIQHACGELERQGYIYSIKGKGSFVANSSHLRAGMLGEWKIRLESSVSGGIKIGVTEEDITGIIKKKCRKYVTERGERHD